MYSVWVCMPLPYGPRPRASPATSMTTGRLAWSRGSTGSPSAPNHGSGRAPSYLQTSVRSASYPPGQSLRGRSRKDNWWVEIRLRCSSPWTSFAAIGRSPRPHRRYVNRFLDSIPRLSSPVGLRCLETQGLCHKHTGHRPRATTSRNAEIKSRRPRSACISIEFTLAKKAESRCVV